MEVIADAAGILVALAAVAASAGMLSRLRAVRWLWRRLVTEPLACWFRSEVDEAVELVLDRKLNGSLDDLKTALDDVRDRTGRIDAKLGDEDT